MIDRPAGSSTFNSPLDFVQSPTQCASIWWMTRDSNPVPGGTDLQSAAVANAARHPKFVKNDHYKN